MDKIKVKYITLDEMKNIDPSLIKSMTFTDGSVALVNSDKEDEKISENKELNQEEKEPDIQNNPNMYINYDSEDDINKNKNINKYQRININQQRIYHMQNQNINTNKK